MNGLGKRLKELRVSKNLTQKEVAEAFNLTQDSISLWEKGKRIPDTIYIILYAKFFDVSADYLLGLEDESGARINNSFNNINNFQNSGNITIK